MNFKKQKAFTLIEVLVVISIIGILSAIIYASFNGAKQRSRDQKRVSDISSIQLALEQYFNIYRTYPLNTKLLVPVYIGTLPKDPLTASDYNYVPLAQDALNQGYCTSYQLSTLFETNSAYLQSKKGFNSKALPTNGLYLCTNGDASLEIDASGNNRIYDVMPQ